MFQTGDQICGVGRNTHYKMEDPHNVTPMASIRAALMEGGVEILMDTANVQGALTSEVQCLVCHFK